LEELETVGRSRCEALGFDRHWNRYWLLGGWDENKGGARRPMLYVSFVKKILLFGRSPAAAVSEGRKQSV
jgi:hypothetical protein